MAQHDDFPDGLEGALEDLARIREMVDLAEARHPMHIVAVPFARYSFVIGVFSVLLGVGAQLLYDMAVEGSLPISGPVFLWIGTLAVIAVFSMLELLTVLVVGKREGVPPSMFLRQVYNRDLIRVAVPIIIAAFLSAAALSVAGQEHMVVGLVTAVVGSVFLTMPLTTPLRAFDAVGFVFLVGGLLSMLFLPEYPFYLFAVVWGVGMALFGILGRAHEQGGC